MVGCHGIAAGGACDERDVRLPAGRVRDGVRTRYSRLGLDLWTIVVAFFFAVAPPRTRRMTGPSYCRPADRRCCNPMPFSLFYGFCSSPLQAQSVSSRTTSGRPTRKNPCGSGSDTSRASIPTFTIKMERGRRGMCGRSRPRSPAAPMIQAGRHSGLTAARS